MAGADGYWFPAKRYGWGWGIPTRWQGWAVLAAYFVQIAWIALLFPPHREQLAFVLLVLVLTLALVAVCWLKGEPPRWRWGDR